MQAWYAPLPMVPSFLVLLCSLAVIVGVIIRQGRNKLWLLLPIAFLCGALRYQAQQTNHALFSARYNGYHDKLIGTVTEKEKMQHPYLRQRITLSLKNDPEVLLYVFTPQKIAILPGDTVQLNDIIISKKQKE